MNSYPSIMQISDEEVARRNKFFTGDRDDTWICPECKRPHPGFHFECTYCKSGVKRPNDCNKTNS